MMFPPLSLSVSLIPLFVPTFMGYHQSTLQLRYNSNVTERNKLSLRWGRSVADFEVLYYTKAGGKADVAVNKI